MEGESRGRGAPQATKDAASPMSHAGDGRQLPRGDIEAGLGCHTRFYGQNQMLIVCMPRIKLSYIWSKCKHRIPMSLL
jgi:hypothetical protein